jgi:hypothetical protein
LSACSAHSVIADRRDGPVAAGGTPSGERDPADGRGLYAALTDEGLEALRTTWPVYARGIAEHFGRHLTDEEVEVLDRALCRVFAAALED